MGNISESPQIAPFSKEDNSGTTEFCFPGDWGPFLLSSYSNGFALCERKFYSYMELIITLLHSERPKLYTILAFLSAIGLML